MEDCVLELVADLQLLARLQAGGAVLRQALLEEVRQLLLRDLELVGAVPVEAQERHVDLQGHYERLQEKPVPCVYSLLGSTIFGT